MGIFNSKTKYYVASQIYNTAGDINDRPDFMKTLAVESALGSGSTAQRLQHGIMNGPGYSLRSFHKWANNNYTRGLPTATTGTYEFSNISSIANQIIMPRDVPSGSKAVVIKAEIQKSNAEFFVEKYLADNRPELFFEDWTYVQDDSTNEITITFARNDLPDIDFTPADWRSNTFFLIYRYYIEYPLVRSNLYLVKSRSNLRDKTALNVLDYNLIREADLDDVTLSLNTEVVTTTEYKDNTPIEVNTVNTSEDVTLTNKYELYEIRRHNKGYKKNTSTSYYLFERKVVNITYDKRVVYDRQVVEYNDRVETIVTSREIPLERYSYDHYNREETQRGNSDYRIGIYRFGSGNIVLDNLIKNNNNRNDAGFLPIFPLRLNNVSIREADSYNDVNKAFKKGFGQDMTQLLDQLEDNESIDDLDYAFMVFGVMLKEKDKTGKKYLYEFFRELMATQNASKVDVMNYIGSHNKNLRRTEAVALKVNAALRNQSYNLFRSQDHLLETQPPIAYRYPSRSFFTINTHTADLNTYDIEMSWLYIDEQFRSGKGRSGAKQGDIWFEKGTDLVVTYKNEDRNDAFNELRQSEERHRDDVFSTLAHNFGNNSGTTNNRIYLYHQTGKLTYRRLEITGFVHSNYVYNNKAVVSTAADTLFSGDEEEEGPIFFPLHMPTFNKMSRKEQNELSQISRLILLNSYEAVKVKWYQRGIFKFLLFVGIAALTVITGGAGAAAIPGLLGTNLAVGTALGLAGTAAIIAGAAANAMAAMILTTIITKTSIKLFGDEFGAIIGAVISFVAFNVGTSFANTGSVAMNWGSMFSADNLLNITSSLSSGASKYIQSKTQSLFDEMDANYDEYKDQLEDINEKTYEMFGQSAIIDPMVLIELNEATKKENTSLRESSGSFLKRTLLTGTDIAGLSMAMIEEFPSASLELPEAFV